MNILLLIFAVVTRPEIIQSVFLRNHIKTFIHASANPSLAEFVAEKYDIFAWGNLAAKGYNSNGVNLLYDYFGTIVCGSTKYVALADWVASNDLEFEDFFLHSREDVNYTLGEPLELDPEVTRTIRGWDPLNDVNGDGFIDDVEFSTRVNILASARFRNQSRVPIYYWGENYPMGTDFYLNIGQKNYSTYLLESYFPYHSHLFDVYSVMIGWEASDEDYFSVGNLEGGCLIYVIEEPVAVNFILKHYVDLERDTFYTIVVNDLEISASPALDGTLSIYPYEFDDLAASTTLVMNTVSPPQQYFTSFKTQTDTSGRVTIRFNGKNGNVTISRVRLVKGYYTSENITISYGQPSIIVNSDFAETSVGEYDGLWLDTCRSRPGLQGNHELVEYGDLENYGYDVIDLYGNMKLGLPEGKNIVIGNGWDSGNNEEFILDGTEFECFATISREITKEYLDEIIEKDESAIVQLLQYNPIYNPILNPNRPDLAVEGISVERDRMYSLALYYLVHGENTYFSVGVHGQYQFTKERYFDAIEFNIGQPLARYYDMNIFTLPDYLINVVGNGDFSLMEQNWTIVSTDLEYDEEIKIQGEFSAHVVNEESLNEINKQYLDLKVNTNYTLSGYIKTENVSGNAQIYVYEFDDIEYKYDTNAFSISYSGTNDWKYERIYFSTGLDTSGRVNFRINGQGEAWFDSINIVEGFYGEGIRHPVFARNFENGIVILNNMNELFNVELGGNYKVLNTNGTLSDDGLITSISIRKQEGVILVRDTIGGDDDSDLTGLIVGIVLSTISVTLICLCIICICVCFIIVGVLIGGTTTAIVLTQKKNVKAKSEFELEENFN